VRCMQICDLFSLHRPKGLQFYIEPVGVELNVETLYFSRTQSQHYGSGSPLLGSIELISGKGEDIEELVHSSVLREVLALDGFLSYGSEVGGHFGFSGKFSVDGVEFSQHHSVIATDAGFTIHICFLQGHSEVDMEEIDNMMAEAVFAKASQIPVFGENLCMKFYSTDLGLKIGNRYYLQVD